MQRYIFIRILQGIFALLVVSVIVFTLSRATGNPVDLMLPPQATEEEREDMIRALGLDRPMAEQYFSFLGNAIKGDFGKSVRSGVKVMDLYTGRVGNTFKLTGVALVIIILGSLPIGVYSALKRGSFFDGLIRTIASIGMAMPMFWFGLMLMQLFAVQFREWGLPALPAGGIGGFSYYILPSVSLAIVFWAAISRLIRSSMLDVLDTEYIKMHRIKGLSERKIVFQHALRNAVIPAITLLGQSIAIILGGAVVIEVVFAWPGVGRLAYEGIVFRDFPVVQGVIMINAVILILANLLIDVMYAYIDPRIRASV